MSEDAEAGAAQAAPAKYDLGKRADSLLEDVIVCDVYDPESGDPIGLKMTFAGPYSTKFRNARRSYLAERIASEKAVAASTPEQIDEQDIEVMARACLSMEWGADTFIDGKQPDCTPDNVAALFRRADWVLEQVRLQHYRRAGFMKG